MSTPTNNPSCSPWPHRVAVLLACVTFPLVWVGGLVTTYRAGMAVPDWPSTYGYNLFLYPWQTWIFGPWDIFIEHGHRLLGAAAGMVSIALVAVTWRTDRRLWLRWLTVAALALVIVQGLLGGGRVTLDQRVIALVHGCLGPAFFAFTVALCTLTSRSWETAERQTDTQARSVQVQATVIACLAYVQLVLGAVVRHSPEMAASAAFRTAVPMHIGLGLMLTLLVVVQAVRVGGRFRSQPLVWRPAMLLGVLILVQVALGGATWVVNYGWPVWFANYAWAQQYVVHRESLMQTHITTAHVALGTLIVAMSLMLSMRSWRVLHSTPWQPLARIHSAGVLA